MMKLRLRFFAFLMGLVLLIANNSNIRAGIITGDTDCASPVGQSYIAYTQISPTTTEYKALGVFNVHRKCVINVYIRDNRYTQKPLYAGKQHSFTGLKNLVELSSNSHENLAGLVNQFDAYFLLIK